MSPLFFYYINEFGHLLRDPCTHPGFVYTTIFEAIALDLCDLWVRKCFGGTLGTRSVNVLICT